MSRKEELSILFIGNSHTYVQLRPESGKNLPQYFLIER